MQLTVRDVAGLFSVSEKTIYRLIKDRSIPAYRINEQYRFHRAEILEWATARKVAVSAEIFRESGESVCRPWRTLTRRCKTDNAGPTRSRLVFAFLSAGGGLA